MQELREIEAKVKEARDSFENAKVIWKEIDKNRNPSTPIEQLEAEDSKYNDIHQNYIAAKRHYEEVLESLASLGRI